MKEYQEVPFIITGKDLDYLKDMFNWQFGAYKNTCDIINNLSDNVLIKAVKSVNKNLFTCMEEILEIMEEYINENN